MPRAHKFECRLQTWVPPEIADTVELLAHEQLLDVADVVRQAIILYLRQCGAMPKVARQNGQHAADHIEGSRP
jgi:hypothetical protein